MAKIDREIKKLSKEFQVPDSYHERVDEILESIRENDMPAPRRRVPLRVAGIVAACCIVLICYLCFSGPMVAEAGVFEIFKQTIFDFLGMGEDESRQIGIESSKENGVGRADLLIELQEKVMDSQSIYMLIKITAPPDVELSEMVTFDYFGFCEGSNYNADNVVPGARSCTLLELLEGKKNIATYVLTISTDQQVEEGKEVTAFFKDLMLDPYGENRKLLVEGMWSVSFVSEYTVSDDAAVQQTGDTVYSYMGTTATVKDVKLLPLGLTLVSDVSNVPVDELHTAHETVTIQLEMADGSVKNVANTDYIDVITKESSIAEYEEDGKRFEEMVCQFKEAVDTSQVTGIYIEDAYVPFEENK